MLWACPFVRPYGLSVCPIVRHGFETPHIFGTMYARILKFHMCIAYEKLADPYCFFPFLHGGVRLPFSDLGNLTNENLVSKISKEPLE